MIIHVFDFESEAEARAFVQGVDFVNDAALGGPTISRDIDTERWLVEVYDYDYSEEKDSEEEVGDDV